MARRDAAIIAAVAVVCTIAYRSAKDSRGVPDAECRDPDQCREGQDPVGGRALAEVEGISEVFSTCGRYDLVAIARTRDFESLAELVTGRLDEVEGIRETETLNAMQVHSRHDLETMFSLGW